MLFFYAVFRVRLVLFRHLQDCHNIFFRQRLEEANVSVSAENAFLSHFLDLGIGWINAKFSEGGWHVYRVAPGLPGNDGCENSIRNIRIAGLGSINSETFSPNCANLPGFVLYTYLAQLPQTAASPAP